MTRRQLFQHLFSGMTGASPAPAVSPLMRDRIAAFRSFEATLLEIDEETDPVGWSIAAELETKALARLLAQRPANIQEFHAKFTALISATATDSEFHILRILADDARLLAEGGER